MIRYDSYTIRNINWLWLVNDIVVAMNSESVLCVMVGNVSRLCIWHRQLGGGNLTFMFLVMSS